MKTGKSKKAGRRKKASIKSQSRSPADAPGEHGPTADAKETSDRVFGPAKPSPEAVNPELGPEGPELPAVFGPEKPSTSSSGAPLGAYFRSALPVTVQTGARAHEEADRNVSLWLGRGSAGRGASASGPTMGPMGPSSGPGPFLGRGKAGLYDKGFAFARQRTARQR